MKITVTSKFIDAFEKVNTYFECSLDEIEEKRIWVRENYAEAEASYFEMLKGVK